MRHFRASLLRVPLWQRISVRAVSTPESEGDMKKKCLRILWSLSLVAISCTYAPEEEYFKNIAESDPDVSILLDNFNQSDTIFIFAQTSFRFNVRIDQGTIKEVQVLVDDKQLLSTPHPSGTFLIHQNNYLRTGIYTLQIQFISSTGSGSMADKLGGEHIRVWRTWILKVFADPPPKPQIKFSSENGFLKLSWTRYDKQNFTGYLVRMWRFGSLKEEIVINNPHLNSVINESYAGGFKIQYEVQIQTFAGSAFAKAEYFDRVDLLGEYRSSDSTMMLSWSKADFPGAFKSYSIIENDVEMREILNVSDTSIRFRPTQVIFGLPVTFYVRLNPVDGSTSNSNAVYQEKLAVTPVLQPAQRYFRFNATLNSMVGIGSDLFALTLYDATMQPQATFSTSYRSAFVPYEGVHIYYGDYVKGIVQVNPQTNEYTYIDIVKMTTGGVFNSPFVVSASSNEIVTFRYRAHNSSGDYLVNHYRVYDMANQVTLYKEEASTAISDPVPVISTDGKYLRFPNNAIYRINGSALEPISELPANEHFLSFRPDNSEEVLTRYGNNVYVYDAQTGNRKRTLTPPGTDYVFRGYDPATKNLFYVAPFATVCYAVDIDTQQRQAISAYTTDALHFDMVNGYLFDTDGDYFRAITD